MTDLQHRPAHSLTKFVTVWFGELVSLAASAQTWFALGVWVYQSTQSATSYTLIMVCSFVPGIVLAPLVGVIVDRFDRRKIMIVSNLAATLPNIAILVLLDHGGLSVWHVYVAAGMSSVCQAFQATTYDTMTPLLVPERHLGRANGMIQAGKAVQIAAPMLAGGLLALIGFRGVIVVDIASFLFAIGVLLVVRLPAEVLRSSGRTERQPLRRDLGHGWRYLSDHPPLRRLMLVYGAYNFLFATAGVLVRPLILSFGSPGVLGVLLFAGGSGVFLGSVAMTAWGGPKRRIAGMLGFMALGGVALSLHSLSPSPWLIAVVAPLFLFTMPIINGSCMALLQSRVDKDSLGRVMATARMLSQAAMPLGYLVAGPLADHVAEPMMRSGGTLAHSMGALIGVGPGRGIALIYAVNGVLMVVLAVTAYLFSGLPAIDDRVPAQPTPEDDRMVGAGTSEGR